MNLVDTSVWIDHVNEAGTSAHLWLRGQINAGQTQSVTEPIIMELLAGAALGRVAELELLVDGLPLIPVDPRHDYRSAANIYRWVRRTGRTVRRLNDCLIAAVAIRTEVTLVHKDADFEAIAEVTPLDHLSLR